MTTDPSPAGGRWFRVNTTWSQSEWLAVLEPAARLAWIEVLSHVKAHGFDGRVRAVTPVVFGRMVGIEAADVRTLLGAAQADGAMVMDDGHWVITGWMEHQGDPTAKYRMQRYRDRNVTPVTRNDRNVTPTETETETETETTDKQRESRRARRVPEKWHRNGVTAKAEAEAAARGIDVDLEEAKMRDHEFDKPRSDWDAAWRNWLRNSRPERQAGGKPSPDQRLADHFRRAQGVNLDAKGLFHD
jgi:DNA segregation ATPase FtsK/SpoIIIE-like protein